MKNILLVASLVLITQSVAAQKSDTRNRISSDFFHLISVSAINAEYERGFEEGKYSITWFFMNSRYPNRRTEQHVGFKRYFKSMNTSSFWYGSSILSRSLVLPRYEIFNGRISSRLFEESSLGVIGQFGFQYVKGIVALNVYGAFGKKLFKRTDNLDFGSRLNTPSTTNNLYYLGLKAGIAF